MGGAGEACKFLGMVFALSLLFQGICAAETDTESNPSLDDTHAFEWVLLLPIFIGSLLFLTWMCRFFDRMNFCFVTFLLMTILLGLLSYDVISEEIRQFLINLVIIITVILVLYEGIFNQRDGNSLINIFKIFMALIVLYIISLLSGISLFGSILREISSLQLIFIIFSIIILYLSVFRRETNNLIINLHDISRNFTVIFSIFIWPAILLYLYQNTIYNVTFYGIDKLKFPVYIIVASYIGILSYLLLSVKETFEQSIPEYKKISIAWSYLRRIIIAPFIAIIGFYMLNSLKNTNEFDEINDYFVFAFSFFAGFFTKTIEDRIYLWVQKYLPKDQKDEFDKRIDYSAKESDFVKKLGCDEDLACMLYNAKIRTIEELACCDAKELINKVNLDTRNLGEGTWCPVKGHKDRLGSYSEQQIRMYINKAQEYVGVDNFDFVKKLKMDRNLAFKLYYVANIKTIEDLSTRNETYICNRLKTCNEEVKEDKIKEYIEKALHYTNIKNSDLIKKLKMPEELVFKISYKTNIDSIQKLKDNTAEKIHEDLADEFKEDVSIDIINKYKELAQKNFLSSSSSSV